MTTYKFLSIILLCFVSRTIGQNCSFSTISYSNNAAAVGSDPFIGDFNLDGKKDVAVQTGSVLDIYLQTTPNNFSSNSMTLTPPSWASFPFLFPSLFDCNDFNNDGKPDILSDGWIYLGQGNGAFVETALTQSIDAQGVNSLIYGVPYLVADFNNDGKKDVLISSKLYTGLGNGQFNSPITTTLNGNTMDVGDFNGDFKQDIAVTNGAVITIYAGLGNATFTVANTFSLATVNNNQIRSIDLNNDGLRDISLIPSSYGTGTVTVLSFISTGNFNFTSTNNSAINIPNTYTVSRDFCTLGDLNNDNYPDLITVGMPWNGSTVNTATLVVNYNNGLGVFGNNNFYNFSTYGSIVRFGGITDLNNDNFNDLAVRTNSCQNNPINVIFSNQNCIWPGDANGNGISNNTDVLEIGLQYNQTGAARTSTSNLWDGYSYTAWTGSVSSGKNKANADCNGDGTVNLSDTLAVYNNYGFLHNKSTTAVAANEDITIVPDQTSVLKGTWGTSSIFLGSSTNNISNIHGVAFTINYDNSVIETDSVWIEYTPSFLNSNNLNFRKKVFSNGILYAATTHTNQVDANGNGKIAILHYKIKSTLASNTVLNLGISNASKLSATAVSSTLSSGSSTLNAVTNDIGVKESSLNSHIVVYPNPSNGQITIKQFDKNQTADLIEIYNTVGQLVFTKKINSMTATVDTNLSKGIYFYSLSNSASQTFKNKLIIE